LRMTEVEHVLVVAQEECVEVAHRISKALRFGLDGVQAGQPLTNAERILEEWADLVGAMSLLGETGVLPDVGLDSFDRAATDKKRRILRWLDYAKDLAK